MVSVGPTWPSAPMPAAIPTLPPLICSPQLSLPVKASPNPPTPNDALPPAWANGPYSCGILLALDTWIDGPTSTAPVPTLTVGPPPAVTPTSPLELTTAHACP